MALEPYQILFIQRLGRLHFPDPDYRISNISFHSLSLGTLHDRINSLSLIESQDEELEAALKMIGKDFDIESLLNKFDNASDLFSFEELLEFVDNTLDTIVGSDILNSIVNGLITDVAEELPIETIEETLALVPWATLEESLRDLDSLNIEKLQEILLSFEDLFKHIINLVTSHEDEIVDAVGEAISGEAELNEEGRLFRVYKYTLTLIIT